jgi:hypothetical protein
MAIASLFIGFQFLELSAERNTAGQFTTGAAGIVTGMDYNLWGGPLIDSAQKATDAYLKSVSDSRLKQQIDASKERAVPKL